MGRWGYTMFQGDRDRDLLCDLEKTADVFIEKDKDMMWGSEAHDGIYPGDSPDKIQATRKKLDAGLGVVLFQKMKEDSKTTCGLDPGYANCVLAAFMMSIGAKITPEHRSYINEKLPGIASHTGFVWPLSDSGFRTPGKAQFVAALENYVDGKPRSFFEPSCYGCGKINADIAPDHLKKCQGCAKNGKRGFYCNRECQKKDWKLHKHICGPHRQGAGGIISLNV